MNSHTTRVALLRGINVGGHHKVPMAGLRKALESQGCTHVETLLNSGNVIFDTDSPNVADLLATHLEKTFGFKIPTLVIEAAKIQKAIENNPFDGVKMTPDTRLYVTFVGDAKAFKKPLNENCDTAAFKIIDRRDGMVFSVVDLKYGKSVAAMAILEKVFGKEITTRNWNTIEKIGIKLNKR